MWDASCLAVLNACAPLARHAPWFSERLLVLLLVRAASTPRSAGSLAKATRSDVKGLEMARI